MIGVALVALAVGSLVLAVYWAAVIVELIRTARELPTARDGVRLADARDRAGFALSGAGAGSATMAPAWPSVCVVIPAHNEGRSIARVAASLLAQDYQSLRVVFALDRCTDDTASVLASVVGTDARFEVVTVGECPAGWAGKTNAVWQGVQRSVHAGGAELLLFADADTEFAPACVRACVALLEARGVDLLSLMTTLSTERWFEAVVQPVACYEMLRQFPPRRVNREKLSRPLANGQFMLFTRRGYERVGGHEAVKEDLLEDIALAKAVRAAGMRIAFVLAAGMMHVRMYESFLGFFAGWKRIFGELAHRRPRRLRKYAVRTFVGDAVLPAMAAGAVAWGGALGGATTGLALFSGEIGSALALIGAAAFWLGALGLGVMLAGLVAGAVWGRSPLYVVLFHPIGAVITALILWRSAGDIEAGRDVVWAGKRYKREARYDGDERLSHIVFGRPGGR